MPSTSRTWTRTTVRRRVTPLLPELVDRDVLTVCGHYPAGGHRPRGHPGRPRRLGARGMTVFREAFLILLVDDVEQASTFYCSTLGFEEAYRNQDEHGVEFVFLALEPYGIGIGRRADGGGARLRALDLRRRCRRCREGAESSRREGDPRADRPALGRAYVLVRRPERPSRPHRREGRVRLVFLKHKLSSSRVTMRAQGCRTTPCVSETQSPAGGA